MALDFFEKKTLENGTDIEFLNSQMTTANGNITSLAGVGRTTETVKGNADNIITINADLAEIAPPAIIINGTTIEDLSVAIGSWTPTNSTLAYEDILDPVSGVVVSKGIKISPTADAATASAQKAINIDLSVMESIQFLVYIDDATALTNVSESIRILLSADGFNTFFWVGVYNNKVQTGLNLLKFNKSEFQKYSTPIWTTPMTSMILRTISTTGMRVNATYGTIKKNVKTTSKALLSFDDIYAEAYTEGYTYLQSKGKKATYFVSQDSIDTSGKATTAEVQILYEAGNDIANHTKTHTQLATLTKDQQKTELTNCKNYFIANGWIGAENHVAYPNGSYNADTFLAMSELGMLTGRTVKSVWNWYPVPNLYELHNIYCTTTTTFAGQKANIDKYILKGGTMMFTMHKLIETPTLDVDFSLAEFKLLVDYLVASGVEFMTISQWYDWYIKSVA